MNTQRFAGMIGLLAVVTLGVVGIDRWTKDAKARQAAPVMQTVSAGEPKPALPPVTNSTIHFQVDPGETPLPPVVLPKESAPPPVISTVEMEKQLKKSIDELQRVLPKLGGAEESSALPPVPPPDPVKIAAPEPKGLPDVKPAPKEDTERPAVPALPPVTSFDVPSKADTLKEPAVAPPAGGLTIPPPPAQQSPKPLAPSITAPIDPPTTATPKVHLSEVPYNELPAAPVVDERAADKIKPISASNVAATIASPQDFQKRLAELEIKYLKDMVAELEMRMKAMPQGELRQKLEMDHQRSSERLSRLIRAVEWDMSRKMDVAAGKMMDSPWTMHMETMDGKTVLQATVHRKARFKIICDRLDLQTPHGTLLAVGHVQISGEGFMGGCDRLSIPLHDDRLVLEGGAEVSVRARQSAIIETNKEGQPPIVEPRRLDEQASSTAIPTLHLKGDHLDLRWLDVAPAAAIESSKADDPQRPIIRGTPGPMVKVAFNSPANERWSEWGILVAMPAGPNQKAGPRDYVIQTREGQILAFVRAPANMSMADYIGKRVSVFGQPLREAGRDVMTFNVSHVAWE